MKKAGYRIFKLKKAIVPNEHLDSRGYSGCFLLDPSGLSGGGWVNADGIIADLKIAEAITSDAMKENPADEFVILPVYKA